MKCLSILRYMTDHSDSVVLGVSTRLCCTHDIPALMIKCLEEKPWLRSDQDGEIKVFEGCEWKVRIHC